MDLACAEWRVKLHPYPTAAVFQSVAQYNDRVDPQTRPTDCRACPLTRTRGTGIHPETVPRPENPLPLPSSTLPMSTQSAFTACNRYRHTVVIKCIMVYEYICINGHRSWCPPAAASTRHIGVVQPPECDGLMENKAENKWFRIKKKKNRIYYKPCTARLEQKKKKKIASDKNNIINAVVNGVWHKTRRI